MKIYDMEGVMEFDSSYIRRIDMISQRVTIIPIHTITIAMVQFSFGESQFMINFFSNLGLYGISLSRKNLLNVKRLYPHLRWRFI